MNQHCSGVPVMFRWCSSEYSSFEADCSGVPVDLGGCRGRDIGIYPHSPLFQWNTRTTTEEGRFFMFQPPEHTGTCRNTEHYGHQTPDIYQWQA